MNNEQRSIWNYLVNNAIGSSNAKHHTEIAKSVGIACTGTNCDNYRSRITDMVVNLSLPIGTSAGGVFIISNDNEREEAAIFLERNNRADVVRRNGNYNPNSTY